VWSGEDLAPAGSTMTDSGARSSIRGPARASLGRTSASPPIGAPSSKTRAIEVDGSLAPAGDLLFSRKPPILVDVETWDALRARRNVRTYLDRAIPEEDLDRILEAARRTPSSMNQQAWDFVVVTERDRLRELSQAWQYAAHVATSATTIALVVPISENRDERDTLRYDLGQVTMSIMLAATDLGIGSGHASIGDQRRARSVLGLPEDRECVMLVALGYPAERPLTPMARPNRRPLDEVVHRERW